MGRKGTSREEHDPQILSPRNIPTAYERTAMTIKITNDGKKEQVIILSGPIDHTMIRLVVESMRVLQPALGATLPRVKRRPSSTKGK